MKNLKKKVILLMTMLLIPALLVACGAKVVPPEESAKILFDYGIKSDESNLSKLGAKQSEIDTVNKSRKDKSIQQFRLELTSQKLSASDEQLEKIYNAVVEAYKKLNATTEVVSKTDSTAVIKVKSTYFDIVKISEKAGTDAVTPLLNSGLSENELKSKFTEAFINNLVEGIKNAEVSTETREKTFNFVLKDKVWVPENQGQYLTDLDLLVSGQIK